MTRSTSPRERVLFSDGNKRSIFLSLLAATAQEKKRAQCPDGALRWAFILCQDFGRASLGGNAAMRMAKLWGFEVWVLFHGSDVLPTKNNVENMKLKKNKIFEHSENWNVLIQFVCEHCFHSRLKNWKLDLIPCCWCWVFFPGSGRSKSGFRQIDFDALRAWVPSHCATVWNGLRAPIRGVYGILTRILVQNLAGALGWCWLGGRHHLQRLTN